jgi:hypothetical protein
MRISYPRSGAALLLTFALSTANALEPISSYRPSAETVLDGKLGYPPSPTVEWKPQPEGFAANRLFHVPKPGVHPRIWFSPEDLPGIRGRLKSGIGKELMDFTREQVAVGIDKAGTWENRLYIWLLEGKLEEFAKLYRDDAAKLSPGSAPPETPERKPAAKLSGQGDAFLKSFEAKAWLDLMDDNAEDGKKLAGAVANYARYLSPRIDAANSGPDGDNYWRGARKVFGDGEGFGLLYDWTQPWMSAEDAKVARGVIAAGTRNHYTLGMDLPAHWVNWNFIGLSAHFLPMALAIEGEEGYDARIYPAMRDVVRNFLTYGIDAKGFTRESVGYSTGGLGNMQSAMLALANRGDNLFIHPHYRRMLDNWLVWTMEPQGGEWVSNGDLGTFPPSPSVVVPAKWLFPRDAKIDYVLQNLPSVRAGKPDWDFLSMILPGEPDRDASGALTEYDAVRGDLAARSDWTREAVMLRFDARCDTVCASHDHPDRGRFTLSAMGRIWAMPSFRESEGKFQNTVMIDGHGAAFFPPPAKWVVEADRKWATFGAVDAKYCWDWMWAKPPMAATDEELKAARLGDYIEPAHRMQARHPREQWERDPLPLVAAYYDGFLKQNPLMWGEDGWVVRAPYFPVQRAFRTAGLVRGQWPYALIMDDIQKDDVERLYEWHMNVPFDVDVVKVNDADIVLGDVFAERQAASTGPNWRRDVGQLEPKPGAPLLLVRTLQISQPDIPTFSPVTPALETFEYLKTDDTHQFFRRQSGMAKRLVIRSRSIAPDFKVLLFPMRQGDPLPVTKWNDDKTQLTIEWNNQKDTFTFKRGADGRTRMTLSRDGQETLRID